MNTPNKQAEYNVHRILCNAKMDYKNEFLESPNMIKMNASTLNKLRMAMDKLCMLKDYSDVMTIFGMNIEIDHSLTEDSCIIYSDKNIYRKINLQEIK